MNKENAALFHALGKTERMKIAHFINQKGENGGTVTAEEIRQKFNEIKPTTLWAMLSVLTKAGAIINAGNGRYKRNPNLARFLTLVLGDIFGGKTLEEVIFGKRPETANVGADDGADFDDGAEFE